MNTDAEKEKNRAITEEGSLEETPSQNTRAKQRENENELEATEKKASNAKKKGSHYFTPDEDKLLAEYWLRCPDNLTAEGRPHFFKCQDVSLPEIYEQGVQVKTRTMKKRFDFFHHHTLKFSAIYNKIKQASLSLGGKITSDAAMVEIAKEDYCQQVGKQFSFDSVWYVFRDHPTWMMQGIESTLPISSAEEQPVKVSPEGNLSNTLSQPPRPTQSFLNPATSEDSLQVEKPAPSVSPTITSSCTPGPASHVISGLTCFLNRRVPNPSVPDSFPAKTPVPSPSIASSTPGHTSPSHLSARPTSQLSGSTCFFGPLAPDPSVPDSFPAKKPVPSPSIASSTPGRTLHLSACFASPVIPNPFIPPYDTERLGTTSSLYHSNKQRTVINPSPSRESSVEIISAPLPKEPQFGPASPPQETSVVPEPLPRSDPQSRPSRPTIDRRCIPDPLPNFDCRFSGSPSVVFPPVNPTDDFGEN
jgi:hypothetical protein